MIYYNVPTHPLSLTQRVVLLVIFMAAYVRTVLVFFRAVQLRILNSLDERDLAIMACLILPFILAPFVRRFHHITRMAWLLSAVMALDVVCFAIMVLGPLGTGHPSLEALASYYLGLAKLVLIPATLILMAVAGVKGEHMGVIGVGFVCLTGATLYASYPPLPGT